MKYTPLLGIVLIVFGMFLIPSSISSVHAANVGLVCLADVTSPPTPPCSVGAGPVFDAPLTVPNHQIKIGVFVNGSGGFNSFQIILKANSTVLKPAGIDLRGSIMSVPLPIAECLGTVNLLPSMCEQASTPDTLELALGNLSAVPTHVVSGLLFTATYNVTATSSSAVSIGFQTGCATSSVGGGVCVAFANGSKNPVPETVQSATFNNTISIPYLTVSISSSSSLKPTPVTSTQSITLNFTSPNNWGLSCTPCTVALYTIQNSTLRVSLSTTTVAISSSNQASVGMTIVGSLAGNYSVSVFAQYQSFDSVKLAPDTLVAHVTAKVQITDFVLSGSALQTATPLVGDSTTSTIRASPSNGFSGTVNLSVSANNCQLTPVTLAVPGPASSQLSCPWSSIGNYTVIVTASTGPLSHTVFYNLHVQDFALSLSAASLTFVAGSSGRTTLNVTGLNGFNQIVGITVTGSNGLTVSPPSLNLGAPGTISLTFTASAPGNYSATATVSFGSASHSITIQVRVTAPASGSPSQSTSMPLVIYAAIGVAGVVVIGVLGLVVRNRRMRSNVPEARSKANSGKGSVRSNSSRFRN